MRKLYRAADLDFRLKAGSAAIDRGVALPNITDGASGKGLISARSSTDRRHHTMVRETGGSAPLQRLDWM